MALRPPSLLARVLAPLPATLWTLFLVWSAIVGVVWIGGIGSVDLDQRVANSGLNAALHLLLRVVDVVWLALAAANVYLGLAEAEGLALARRWGAMVVVACWAIGALSVWTGFPLGPIHFTGRLGMSIGPVPLGWIFFWLTAVVGARALALRVAPRASHWQISLGVGILVALTAANLDPLAWRYRAFWLWPPETVGSLAATAQHLGAWLVAGTGLALAMREMRVASTGAGAFPRAASVFLICHGVFLATHAARLAR